MDQPGIGAGGLEREQQDQRDREVLRRVGLGADRVLQRLGAGGAGR